MSDEEGRGGVMKEWDFKVVLHSQEKEFRVATCGMSFEVALARAVKLMIEQGRPWGRDDKASIYDAPYLGWLIPTKDRRPLLTFMPPLGYAAEWEEDDND